MSKNVSSVNHFAHKTTFQIDKCTHKTCHLNSVKSENVENMEFIIWENKTEILHFNAGKAISYVVTSCAMCVHLCHLCFLQCVVFWFIRFEFLDFQNLMFPTVSIVTQPLYVFMFVLVDIETIEWMNEWINERLISCTMKQSSTFHLCNWNVNYFRELFEK